VSYLVGAFVGIFQLSSGLHKTKVNRTHYLQVGSSLKNAGAGYEMPPKYFK